MDTGVLDDDTSSVRFSRYARRGDIVDGARHAPIIVLERALPCAGFRR